MKRILLSLLVFGSCKCFCQNNGDAIIGKWLKIPKEDLVIEVYKMQDEYKGKIIWSKDHNKKKPVGFTILEKLKYNQRYNNWVNGKITDPNTGATYTAAAKIISNGELEVNGYLGFSIFGIKKNFKRLK